MQCISVPITVFSSQIIVNILFFSLVEDPTYCVGNVLDAVNLIFKLENYPAIAAQE
jgi:hypothetical protein